MKQKLILLALVFGLTIVSQSSLSLGMGKIQVYSALGEPLQSSIDILTNTDEELVNLTVTLASNEDYQKVGLDKSFVPANIMVSLDEDRPHQINVTSNGPITEPIVSLLLDVNWNNGRILREFTLLLDPPVYDSISSNVQVTNVVVEPIQDNSVVEPATNTNDSVYDRDNSAEENQVYTNEDVEAYTAEAETNTTATDDAATESTEPTYAAVNTAGNQVSVSSGDTLWSIANNNKVGDLSTHQMMMAIYNSNSGAFIDNNINKLIKGSQLTMPSADEARSIGLSEALAQVESHHNSWAPASQNYSSYQTESTVEDTVEDTTSDLDYGVQLSGNDSDGSDAGQSNSDEGADANVQAMEEDLYNKDSENTELKDRISELEEIVDQQQEVLEIKDDSLSNLSEQLANTDETTEAGLTEDDTTATETDDIWDDVDSQTTDENADESAALMTDTEGVENSDAMLDSDDGMVDGTDTDNDMTETDDALMVDVDDTVDSENQTTDAAETAAEEEVQPITQTKAKVAEEESMVDTVINWVMANLKWVLAGLVGLIVLIFLPRMLSRDDGDDDETSFLDDIKNRKQANNEVEAEDVPMDEAETKMNQPLQLDDDDDEDEDVLAELDKSIVFGETGRSHSAEDDEGEDEDPDPVVSDDETEEVEADDDEDGFDLDGFLNDDDLDDDISVTADHSKTLAGVSFDDDEQGDTDVDSGDADEAEVTLDESDEEVDFGEFDLDLDDDSLDLDDDGSPVAENASEAGDDDSEEVADDSDEEFSFDDDFDFNLDDELEELEQEDELINADETPVVDEVDTAATDDDFNEVVDISDENTDQFETTKDEVDMDEEIDLGLEDLLDDADAIGTKLDLAKAYIDMGDAEGAKNLLDEIMAEGNDEQVEAAKKLLDDM